MPNGSNVKTEISGEVKLNDYIVLKDMLYLPMLEFNLISVSKILRTINCCLVFCNDACLIRETFKRIIGSAKLLDGLYHMDLPEKHLKKPLSQQIKVVD